MHPHPSDDNGARAGQRPFWEKSYPEGVSSAEPLPPPSPVEDLLEQAARRWPEAEALDFYDFTLDYRGLRDLAARAARGFQSLGVGPGVNVGLHLLNTPHYVVCAFGVLMAGGRVVNFSPQAAPRELRGQLADSEVRVLVTLDQPTLYPQAAALKGGGRLETLVVCRFEDFLSEEGARTLSPATAGRQPGPGREVEFRDLVANDGLYERPARGPLVDEVAVIAYSGGTTGEPKGAMLTHANFSALVNIYLLWTSRAYWPEVRKALVVLPLCHIFGFAPIMLLVVATGGVMVLHTRFDVNRVLADLSRKQVTTFAGVPAMYSVLVGHTRIGEFDLSSLRHCNVGGAPLPHHVLERFRALTGLTPQVGYGLTETTALATMQVVDGEQREGTAGLPAPHTVIEVVDVETGTRVLPVGEVGEICCRGPHVMKGYWKRPLETAEAFAGGRFHTGDIGFLDEDGYLTVVDRKKDMIITGGRNVFPNSVESVIGEHPSVAAVAVVGVPDPSLGHLLKAFVELRPGHAPFGYDELKAFLADKVAGYEIPVELEFRDALPRTAVGKLSKKELTAA